MSARLSRRAAFGAAAALPVAGVASCQPVPAASAPFCPAAALGRELARLVADFDAADEAAVRGPLKATAAACARADALAREVGRVFHALADVQATSVPGILAQALAASANASSDSEISAARVAEVRRLLLSVITAAEALGGVPREAMAGEFLARRELDARPVMERSGRAADADLVAMADEAARLWAVYEAKGEFLDDLLDDITEEEAARAENAFYAEAEAAMKLADRMAETRAASAAGLEAKARIAMIFDREHAGYDKEEVFKLGRSIAADIEGGVLCP